MIHHLLHACLVATVFSAAVRAQEPVEPRLVIPVRVHLLQSSNQPQVHTTLAESDVRRIIGKVNRVWSQANIQFELESIVREQARQAEAPEENPNDRWMLNVIPADTRATNAFNIYYVKRMQPNGYWSGGVAFVKDTASLKPVPGGIEEPLPRVTSHELGHALGLPHRQNLTNLMASGTTGTALDEEEIQRARASALKKDWVRKVEAK